MNVFDDQNTFIRPPRHRFVVGRIRDPHWFLVRVDEPQGLPLAVQEVVQPSHSKYVQPKPSASVHQFRKAALQTQTDLSPRYAVLKPPLVYPLFREHWYARARRFRRIAFLKAFLKLRQHVGCYDASLLRQHRTVNSSANEIYRVHEPLEQLFADLWRQERPTWDSFSAPNWWPHLVTSAIGSGIASRCRYGLLRN